MPTYTLLPGLSRREKIMAAWYLLCKPCCPEGSGSGSGSGSGGGAIVPCCDAVTPTTLSWAITGVTGITACLSATVTLASLVACSDPPCIGDCNEICDPGFCYVDSEGCLPVADLLLSAATIRAYCSLDGAVTDLTLSICCIQPPDGADPFPTRYRMSAILTVPGGQIKWCTDIFNVASCSPFILEVDQLSPYFNSAGGTPTLAVVLT